MTNEKIDKYYKNSYLIIATIALYLFILIFKNMFYSLFNLDLSNLTNKENLIIDITYQLFSLIMSINFFIKNKNSSLDEFKKYLKTFLIGVISIIVYSLTSLLELSILYFFRVNVGAMTIISKTIYLISCELLIMSIIAIINNKALEKSIKNINLDLYKDNIKYYVFALFIMMLSNLLINIINPGIAGNEQTIRDTFTKAPIYMFFSAVIFAPFSEEMIFRLSIRNIIKNNRAFILASGLIFGGLHVIGNINTLLDILYVIPYSVPGFVFAYMLTKTDNILVPIGFHLFHNGVLMLLQVIALFI